ncbi:hypothetical protein DLAC_11568 [Tieghemostelium lacteum]|uniref:DUF7743 domain-containing protein n=1 Tax=Tieghemostelium lacteum TaxID=361077 RepID=A0A151ZRU7_TIELA|nr:hypothetical protein DLAC_11568 [Tieghemostelium lacteum]|eukprot:KYQ96650.1 hypothetical protein DLAC_11568 [Tieghemostelium lacteum]
MSYLHIYLFILFLLIINLYHAQNLFQIKGIKFLEYPKTYSSDECDIFVHFLIDSGQYTMTVDATPQTSYQNTSLYMKSFTIDRNDIPAMLTVDITVNSELDNYLLGNYTCKTAPTMDLSILNMDYINFRRQNNYKGRLFFRADTGEKQVSESDFTCNNSPIVDSCLVGKIGYSNIFYMDLYTQNAALTINPISFDIVYNSIPTPVTIYPYENTTFSFNMTALENFQDISVSQVSDLYFYFQSENNNILALSFIGTINTNVIYNYYPLRKTASSSNLYTYMGYTPLLAQSNSVQLYQYDSNSQFTSKRMVTTTFTPVETPFPQNVLQTTYSLGTKIISYNFNLSFWKYGDLPSFNQKENLFFYTFPFGFIGIENSVPIYNAAFVISISQAVIYNVDYFSSTEYQLNPSLPDIIPPRLENVYLTHFEDNGYLLTVQASDDITGVYKIIVGNPVIALITTADLVSGDILNGVYQKMLNLPNSNVDLDLLIVDRAFNEILITEGDIFNFNPQNNLMLTVPSNPFQKNG